MIIKILDQHFKTQLIKMMEENELITELLKVIIAKETVDKIIEHINDLLIYFDNHQKSKRLVGEIYLELKDFNKKIKGINKDFEYIIKNIKTCVYKVYTNKESFNRQFFYDVKELLLKVENNICLCRKHYLRKYLSRIEKFGDHSL